jgi:hypothetical protein
LQIGGLPCGWLVNSKDGSPMVEPPHPMLAKGNWSRSWACRAAIGRSRSSWRPPYRRRRPNMKP